MESGLLFFAKHAYPASRKSACGPANPEILRKFIQTSQAPRNIRQILMNFPDAVKNLQRIAKANGIKDIFDYRVVEAYWIGNNLLNKFPIRTAPFHLSQILKSIRSGQWSSGAAKFIEDCRIAYGRILSVKQPITKDRVIGTAKILEYWPLAIKNKSLGFASHSIKQVKFIDPNIQKNNLISLHHGYICSSLTEKQFAHLASQTLLRFIHQ